jgi:hypothetical protein
LLQQLAGLGRRVAGGHGTEAAGDPHSFAALQRRPEDVDHPVAKQPKIVVGAQLGTQEHELVASDACHGVGAARDALEPVSHLGEDAVADLVTERVVDALEIVEVDEHQRQAAGSSFERAQGLAQPVHQRDPVRQSG